MKITRQGKNTERRVIVTLSRHERQTPATSIINKIKRNKAYKDIVEEYGASVRYECRPGVFTWLYSLRPDQFLPKPTAPRVSGIGFTGVFIDESSGISIELPY